MDLTTKASGIADLLDGVQVSGLNNLSITVALGGLVATIIRTPERRFGGSDRLMVNVNSENDFAAEGIFLRAFDAEEDSLIGSIEFYQARGNSRNAIAFLNYLPRNKPLLLRVSVAPGRRVR